MNNSSSEQIVIPEYIKQRVKTEVVEYLGLKNPYELNDKVDGVFYLNKVLKKVLAIYAVEKFLKKKLISGEKLIDSKTSFKHNGYNYQVLGFELNNKIRIPDVKGIDYFLIVGIFNGFKKVKILGQISYEECLKISPNGISNAKINKYLCEVDPSRLSPFS